MLVISGTKIKLRPKQAKDAWNDYQWRIDQELSRLDANVPIRISFAEFQRISLREIAYPGSWAKPFALETFDDKHIGNCMLYDIDTVSGCAELGVMIGDRSYWGQGYGYDAVVTLLEYSFGSMSLELIYLHTLTWNRRAYRCFRRAGFLETRLVSRNGHSFARMDLTRQRWGAIREVKPISRGVDSPTLCSDSDDTNSLD